jgi:hypothetical protein
MSCTTVFLFGCEEWVESLRKGLTIHADAIILDGDQNIRCFSPRCWFIIINSCGFDRDGAALRHRITGVHDEIQERVL